MQPVGTHGLKWYFMLGIILIIGYHEEHERDKNNESISTINETLQNEITKGIIIIFINFIACFAQEFVQDLDFFQQQNKPVFPFVEGCLEQLTSYIEGNRIAQNFGPDLEDLII